MTSPDHLSRLLAVERAVSPPSGTAEAELQRLLGSLAAHAAPLSVGVGSLKLGWSVVAKWIGVGFAVGVAGAGAASFVANDGPSGQVVMAPVEGRPAPSQVGVPLPPTEVELPAPAASAVQAAPLVDGSRRAMTPTPGPAVSTHGPVPSSAPGLDEELRLITAAKREVDQGRAHLARVWLDEHRQRFPTGVFALEREGLVALAACSGASNPSLARDFAKRHPESPMLAQVLRRCGAGGPSEPAPPASKDFVDGDK